MGGGPGPAAEQHGGFFSDDPGLLSSTWAFPARKGTLLRDMSAPSPRGGGAKGGAGIFSAGALGSCESYSETLCSHPKKEACLVSFETSDREFIKCP